MKFFQGFIAKKMTGLRKIFLIGIFLLFHTAVTILTGLLLNYLLYSGRTGVTVTEEKISNNSILEFHGKYFINFYPNSNDLDSNLKAIKVNGKYIDKVYTDFQLSSYSRNDQKIYISYNDPRLVSNWVCVLIVLAAFLISLTFGILIGILIDRRKKKPELLANLENLQV